MFTALCDVLRDEFRLHTRNMYNFFFFFFFTYIPWPIGFVIFAQVYYNNELNSNMTNHIIIGLEKEKEKNFRA